MCSSCDDDGPQPDPLVITPDLIRYTREIESDLPGSPVPEEAWPVFFGARGGSIIWPHYERMARSREAALVLVSMGCRNGAISQPAF